MSLGDIAVKVEHADNYSVGNLSALLAEIASCLQHLIQTGKPSLLDLKSLPLSPQEYEQLRQLLGQGEVSARLEAIGPSEIVETRYPGVWWVTHFNVEGDIIADLIEIDRVPAILCGQTEDMQMGLNQLQAMLAQGN